MKSPRLRLRDRWPNDFTGALALIALAGLVLRVVYVVWTRNTPVLGDGVVYHRGALDLVDGVGFYIRKTGRAQAGHPPAWPIVLAGPSVLGLRSWLSHQLFTCMIGTATIVMTGLAGRAAFGRRVGVIAAAVAAFYPFVWLYEREVLSEPLVMLGAATTIWIAYRFRARPGFGLALAIGISVGVMAMTRSELVGIAALLVAPLILSAHPARLRQRSGWLAAAALGCVLVIGPWALYNSTRFADPVPLSTGLGAAMATGNCGPTYHGKLLGYYKFGCIFFFKDVNRDFSIADRQYLRHALDFMSKNKSRVPIVMAARAGRTFGVFRPAQQMHLETERSTNLWVMRLAFIAYWVLLPLALAGFVRARQLRIPAYPLLVFPLLILLSVLPTIGSVRYRAPAEVSLIILSALGIDAIVGGARHRLSRTAQEVS